MWPLFFCLGVCVSVCLFVFLFFHYLASVILLMAEILHRLRYMKPYQKWGKLPTSTGERWISAINSIMKMSSINSYHASIQSRWEGIQGAKLHHVCWCLIFVAFIDPEPPQEFGKPTVKKSLLLVKARWCEVVFWNTCVSNGFEGLPGCFFKAGLRSTTSPSSQLDGPNLEWIFLASLFSSWWFHRVLVHFGPYLKNMIPVLTPSYFSKWVGTSN